MYKHAAIIFIVCFCCYILFSREPDYFEGEFTPGYVQMNSARVKFIQYRVGTITYKSQIIGWGASQVAEGEKVKVIYDPLEPSQASLYTFFAYWLTLPELITCSIAFIALFSAAIFITGENLNDDEEPDESSYRKRKYND